MSDYTDISGMDLHSAKEYVAGYIATLKQTQVDVKKAEEELAVWDGRVKLAVEHGRPDLESAARTRADELRAKIGRLKVEEQQLLSDIERMKTQLKAMEHRPTFTVDAELLLAQLEQVVGEEDTTASKFRDTEADRALDELKRKLGMPVPERQTDQPAQDAEPGQDTETQDRPVPEQEPQNTGTEPGSSSATQTPETGNTSGTESEPGSADSESGNPA
jgi:hypothetical protein